jgi:GTP:adenosylcobinamide-phosphate guanylyltransferase
MIKMFLHLKPKSKLKSEKQETTYDQEQYKIVNYKDEFGILKKGKVPISLNIIDSDSCSLYSIIRNSDHINDINDTNDINDILALYNTKSR